MRLLGAALALLLASQALADPAPSSAATTAASPRPDDARLVRPTSTRRRALQVTALSSLVLVVGGSALLLVSLARYIDLRDHCFAGGGCTAGQVLGGKVEQGLGWGLVSAGAVAALVTMLVAVGDSRAEANRTAPPPGPPTTAWLPTVAPLSSGRGVDGVGLGVTARF